MSEVPRAHSPPLLEAGVRIYEYTPGFIHAKNFVVDDRFATVGTVNLDYRSLFLHFENGVWLCGDPTVRDIKADFLATLEQCQPVTLEQSHALPWWRKAYRAVLRVFAPLMYDKKIPFPSFGDRNFCFGQVLLAFFSALRWALAAWRAARSWRP